MKQSDLVNQFSDEELKKTLLVSQIIFIILAFILSIALFENIADWLLYIKWDFKEIIYYGMFSGLLIVAIDIILIFTLPKRFYDDGGINERIFKSLSVSEIFLVALIVAISEELLFRGVIQTTFGYVFASIIFALVHVRYLKKPVLLLSVLLVSFYIGYMFELTGNLLVTIIAHFIVDFLLGLIIRFKK